MAESGVHPITKFGMNCVEPSGSCVVLLIGLLGN